MKTACITGISGQTGSYMAELLLKEGYKVHGLKRRSSSHNTERIDHIYQDPHIENCNLELAYGDLSDYASLSNWIGDIKPDLFFNLGAMSHVAVSFSNPIYTMDITGTGVMRVLEVLKNCSPTTRFLQASSSEMFGSSPPPQNELTTFHPRSPYGVSKVAGYYATINYREIGLFACNAISFNHESPRRSPTFVTRKITQAATRIKLGLQDKLFLGNLSAARDWSHALDVCDGMFKIITAERADDYVIASGETHSVRELAELVFDKLDLDYRDYVELDSRYLRPTEVEALCGDPSKIKKELGWEPKYSFTALIDEMVESDMELAKREKMLKDMK
jgi:GDPmannose 4,6-dehydratase